METRPLCLHCGRSSIMAASGRCNRESSRINQNGRKNGLSMELTTADDFENHVGHRGHHVSYPITCEFAQTCVVTFC